MKDNKYYKWYNNIILNAKNRINDGYVEIHHIIPKCMGGLDTENNLVNLTAREHYICHWLLTKIVESKKHQFQMLNAFSMMFRDNKNHKRIYSRNFESLKLICSKRSKLYHSIKTDDDRINTSNKIKEKWNSKSISEKESITKRKVNTRKEKLLYLKEHDILEYNRIISHAKDANRNNWKIIFPDLRELETKDLQGFARDNNLSYTCLTYMASGKTKQEAHKGFQCYKLFKQI